MLLFYYKRCVINVDDNKPLLGEENNGLFIDDEELILPVEKKEEQEEVKVEEKITEEPDIPIFTEDDVIEKEFSYKDTPEEKNVSDEPTEEVKSISIEDLEKNTVLDETSIESPKEETQPMETEEAKKEESISSSPFITLEDNPSDSPSIEEKDEQPKEEVPKEASKVEEDNKEEVKTEEPKKEHQEEPKETPKKEGSKNDKVALITTIVLAVIVLTLLFLTIRNFYYGFKYRDYDLTQEVTENQEGTLGFVPKDVSLESVVMQNTYAKINSEDCAYNLSIAPSLYTDEKKDLNSMSIEEIGTILFNYLNKNCQTEAKVISKEEVRLAMLDIFGTEEYLSSLEINEKTYGNNKVTFNQNNFTIIGISCNLCDNNYVLKNIDKSVAENDFLYIYEKFGYIKEDEIKKETYHVYADAQSKKEISTFIKVNDQDKYNDLSTLKVYKWTFLKGKKNNYHFVSIEPMKES